VELPTVVTMALANAFSLTVTAVAYSTVMSALTVLVALPFWAPLATASTGGIQWLLGLFWPIGQFWRMKCNARSFCIQNNTNYVYSVISLMRKLFTKSTSFTEGSSNIC
jgi:hypothetical protein